MEHRLNIFNRYVGLDVVHLCKNEPAFAGPENFHVVANMPADFFRRAQRQDVLRIALLAKGQAEPYAS